MTSAIVTGVEPVWQSAGHLCDFQLNQVVEEGTFVVLASSNNLPSHYCFEFWFEICCSSSGSLSSTFASFSS